MAGLCRDAPSSRPKQPRTSCARRARSNRRRRGRSRRRWGGIADSLPPLAVAPRSTVFRARGMIRCARSTIPTPASAESSTSSTNTMESTPPSRPVPTRGGWRRTRRRRAPAVEHDRPRGRARLVIARGVASRLAVVRRGAQRRGAQRIRERVAAALRAARASRTRRAGARFAWARSATATSRRDPARIGVRDAQAPNRKARLAVREPRLVGTARRSLLDERAHAVLPADALVLQVARHFLIATPSRLLPASSSLIFGGRRRSKGLRVVFDHDRDTARLERRGGWCARRRRRRRAGSH